MADIVLAFNAGSTSLRFAAYERDEAGAPCPRIVGSIDALQGAARFEARNGAGQGIANRGWAGGHPIGHEEACCHVVEWLHDCLSGSRVVAAGHRLMLGPTRHRGAMRIDAAALDTLAALSAIEPSHQPIGVRGARVVAALLPDVVQVACFDSAFHQTMPEAACAYALPQAVRDAGIRRRGYHGLSYEYISERMRSLAPQARRVVVAHLGGGSSLCAMLDGRSVETTMGLSALSGLPMATRSGDIPPEALLFLLKSGRFDVASLESMLYERSGLLGLSGISGDVRALQDSPERGAAGAMAHFVHALTKSVGAYAAVLGGIDALVFTGGVGEHSHPVRSALCRNLSSLGVVIDEDANRVHAAEISAAGARVAVHVIPTDEEKMIARHTLAQLDAGDAGAKIASAA